MKSSIVYRSPFIYGLVMRFLYGLNYSKRYKVLVKHIPPGDTVLDVCCGDGVLYTKYLKGRNNYKGIDINATFIKRLAESGADAECADVLNMEWPQADVVVMQASLYQFMPRHCEVVDKMIACARKRLIISEPIRNMASSKVRVIAALAKHSVNPGNGHKVMRFDESTFRTLFLERYHTHAPAFQMVSGGRECIVILSLEKLS